MNLRYFFYHFENIETGEKVRFDIRPFLKQFASLKAPEFKNKIRHHDEYLYLTHQFTNVFMLIQTKQNEIIRKVNTNDLSVDDVNKLLKAGEHFGFAAYLIMEADYFGICSTLMAPRFEALSAMFDSLFELLGLGEWRFVPTAMLTQIAPSKIKDLNYVGRTTVRVQAGLNFGEAIRDVLGQDVDAFDYIDEIEITLKPKRNRNLSEVANRIVQKSSQDEITRMTMRAKESVNSAMMDVYLAESGIISDQIAKRTSKELTAVMQEKMSANGRLNALVKEYRDENVIRTGVIDDISSFSSPDIWVFYTGSV